MSGPQGGIKCSNRFMFILFKNYGTGSTFTWHVYGNGNGRHGDGVHTNVTAGGLPLELNQVVKGSLGVSKRVHEELGKVAFLAHIEGFQDGCGSRSLARLVPCR